MALLVVMLLISMTLGLSYAAIRSQHAGLRIQRNSDRRASARQAAMTGLTLAIKKMHTDDWGGVETALSGSLGSDYETFVVKFTAGDPSLDPSHPDYADLPYRVTLLSTGYAADPDNPQCIATYRIRAVVRLAPRTFSSEPDDWPQMQSYTLYQWKKDSFEIDIPCRFEGPVRLQGKLKLANHYPNNNDAWARYLRDLNQMRLSGMPDYRTFNGPVHLPFSEQDWKYRNALTNYLGVTDADVPVDEVGSDWSKPVSLTHYQIYEGGPVYAIPALGTVLENHSLGPDPLTNPLGIYYRNGDIAIRQNVTIRGSLFCSEKILVEGGNVHFEPVEMPALHGSEGTVRLPAVSCRMFKVRPWAGGGLRGLVAVFDEFEILKSPETVAFSFEGRVITRKLFIKERQPWEQLNWGDYFEDFEKQLDGSEGPVVPYFPVWMGHRGRDPAPRLTVKPDSTTVRYHWHNWYDPIYTPGPDDDGLHWDLLEWTENP